MAATPGLTEAVLYDTLVNYLVSMAHTVEGAMNRALDAIVSLENLRTSALPGEWFLFDLAFTKWKLSIINHPIGCFGEVPLTTVACISATAEWPRRCSKATMSSINTAIAFLNSSSCT